MYIYIYIYEICRSVVLNIFPSCGPLIPKITFKCPHSRLPIHLSNHQNYDTCLHESTCKLQGSLHACPTMLLNLSWECRFLDVLWVLETILVCAEKGPALKLNGTWQYLGIEILLFGLFYSHHFKLLGKTLCSNPHPHRGRAVNNFLQQQHITRMDSPALPHDLKWTSPQHFGMISTSRWPEPTVSIPATEAVCGRFYPWGSTAWLVSMLMMITHISLTMARQQHKHFCRWQTRFLTALRLGLKPALWCCQKSSCKKQALTWHTVSEEISIKNGKCLTCKVRRTHNCQYIKDKQNIHGKICHLYLANFEIEREESNLRGVEEL